MRRRFIIATQDYDADESKRVTDFLSKHGAWWHWISNFWLFTTTTSDISCEKIGKHISSINDRNRALVMEVPEDVDWSVFGAKNAKGQSMATWLSNTWAKQD
ncbi:hypothetical protein Rleg9DRAFT_1712 [Rhizobium leguminosarum bv. trifolii WSM597]|uniref:Uncharacterized protein n=1 Tax=Rhizobium leguminosarum bv. trifolii WSM597 TaxID=754764 RepID=J0GZ80_RHILT|nr:hypothetical protein Rleg9DRAFT_1712 [Rhizobium leguminosarum bv. trifolii WSM597]